ncbi:MAG TPA: hypothetical protein VGO36_05735 [Solirubrobacterales bacterium]|jgi:hypothetical protein|nr:hypothetical protein [Solirubrobacterales bacterium]
MEDGDREKLDSLEPLVGEWSMEAVFAAAPPSDERGRTAFQWGPERAFLIQRWEVPMDGPPDGVAIIAVAEGGGELVQHYFDSRGVVRRYETSLEDRVWSLRKLSAGFAQRFRGELSPDGSVIDGAWEKGEEGSGWERDFGLVYRRVG